MSGMKVMNIGIIIRNDHDDTFPVALTPQMVSIIQNLLTQIPALNSKLTDASGKPIVSKASIPIIPREMEFDWDRAYSPMMPEEELKLMKALNDKYEAAEALKPDKPDEADEVKKGGIIVPEGMGKDDDEDSDPENKVTTIDGKKPLLTDPLNPFNLECKGEGRANVDLEKAGSDTEPDPNADDRVSIGSDKAEQMADDAETAGAQPTPNEAKAAGAELDKQTGSEETPAAGDGDCTVTPDALDLSGEQNKI